MKAVLGLVTVLVLLGVVYGLAFMGIIPCKKLAAKTPALKPVFLALKLIKRDPPVKVSNTAATASAAPDPLAGEKADIATQQLQLDREKAALDQKAAQAAAKPAAPPPVVTSAKVSAIYDTMKPDQLATLFAKLPDPSVCDALVRMDEDKAGKVLAAMPADRSARLTILMNKATVNNPQPGQQPQPAPGT